MTEVSAAVLAAAAFPEHTAPLAGGVALTPGSAPYTTVSGALAGDARSLNVLGKGAKGDATSTSAGSLTASSSTVTATAFFASAAVGQVIQVHGGGGVMLSVADGQVQAGTKFLYSPSGLFTARMMLRLVKIVGAGAAGGDLIAGISAVVGANWLVLNVAASTTVTAATVTVVDDFEGTITSVTNANAAVVAGMSPGLSLTAVKIVRGTDDAAAFRAAHDALGGQPGSVIVPAGSYVVSHVEISTSGFKVIGAGEGSTVIFATGSQDTFSVNLAVDGGGAYLHGTISDVEIRGLRGAAGACQTAGALVAVGNANRVYLNDFQTLAFYGGNVFEGVRQSDGELLVLDRYQIYNCVSHGVHSEPRTDTTHCLGLTLTDDGLINGNGGSGLYVRNGRTNTGTPASAEGMVISCTSLQGNGRYGMEFVADGGGYVKNILSSGLNACDSNFLGGTSIANTGTLAKAMSNIHFMNAWHSFNGNRAVSPVNSGHGFYAKGVYDLTYDGGVCILSAQSGIVIDGCVNFRVLNIEAAGNNQGAAAGIAGGVAAVTPAAGAEYAIKLLGACDNGQVMLNMAGNLIPERPTDNVQSGIWVDDTVTNTTWGFNRTPSDAGATAYRIPSLALMATNHNREFNNDPLGTVGDMLSTSGRVAAGGALIKTQSSGGATQAFGIADSAGANALYFRSASGNIQVLPNGFGSVIGILTQAFKANFGGSGTPAAQIEAHPLTGVTALGLYPFESGTVAQTIVGPSGETMTYTWWEETITLSTSGLTTDGVGNILRSNSLMIGGFARVTTAITGPTATWNIGDTTTAGKYVGTQSSKLTLGSTAPAISQNHTANASAADAVQASNGNVRITVDAIPTAGAIKMCILAITFGAPTS